MSTASSEKNSKIYAGRMGPELQQLVEKQLLAELPHYKIEKQNLSFDWSGSTGEGRSAEYLDGTVENLSGVLVLDEAGNVVADGWMEFILEPDFFLAYWDHITTREGKKKLAEKQMPGIPKHVWKQLPEDLKHKFNKKRLKG
ncbi:MAG TPA: hypothetical protein VK927_10330 [Adhaeribacter sp.]|nr:hypothetical protein [Adhaeribacter sp.]